MGRLFSGRAARRKGRFPTAVAGSDATNAAAIDDADNATADAIMVEINTVDDATLNASNDAAGGR